MQSQRRPMQVSSQCLITVVVKIPRLPFDKFISAKRTLTTQMKATGEVMSICNNFEGALDESNPFSGAACRQSDVL